MPDVYFGSPESQPVDWKKIDEGDMDDEVMAKTPSSIVGVLGFDPLDIDDAQAD